MKESFIFYRSFQDAINNCPINEQLDLYKAISKYALDREEPKFNGIKQSLWILIKPQLEANWRRFENGCKGGAPLNNKNNRFSKKMIQIQPSNNPNTTNIQANDNVNDNNNINVNESKNKTYRFIPPSYEEIKNYVIENSLNVDSLIFYNHYESNGWMIGKNKMKSWQAAINNWSNREKSDTSYGMILQNNSEDKFKNMETW